MAMASPSEGQTVPDCDRLRDGRAAIHIFVGLGKKVRLTKGELPPDEKFSVTSCCTPDRNELDHSDLMSLLRAIITKRAWTRIDSAELSADIESLSFRTMSHHHASDAKVFVRRLNTQLIEPIIL